jgi:hypothetical protein
MQNPNKTNALHRSRGYRFMAVDKRRIVLCGVGGLL